jgi:hypothetical protein
LSHRICAVHRGGRDRKLGMVMEVYEEEVEFVNKLLCNVLLKKARSLCSGMRVED